MVDLVVAAALVLVLALVAAVVVVVVIVVVVVVHGHKNQLMQIKHSKLGSISRTTNASRKNSPSFLFHHD